mmetsp:Transcript_94879/g.306290  ORF Transcript_94879/g.306290 Transcript_94879/m.306290 type:complete len:123 (+) Transcript_94879:89-457(+)
MHGLVALAIRIAPLLVSTLAVCEDYYREDEGRCAVTCLGASLGLCPRSAIVENGGLTQGNCSDLGMYVADGDQIVQQAGPCGDLTFNTYGKRESAGIASATVSLPSLVISLTVLLLSGLQAL